MKKERICLAARQRCNGIVRESAHDRSTTDTAGASGTRRRRRWFSLSPGHRDDPRARYQKPRSFADESDSPPRSPPPAAPREPEIAPEPFGLVARAGDAGLTITLREERCGRTDTVSAPGVPSLRPPPCRAGVMKQRCINAAASGCDALRPDEALAALVDDDGVAVGAPRRLG